MLDWIFEGIITWVSSIVSDMMDAVSGLFLQALRYGYDSDGRILPVCYQSLYGYAVYCLGNIVFDNHLAAIPYIWWTDNRS